MIEHFCNGKVALHAGDCRDVIRTMPDNSIASVCTDPPYALVFMGKTWDNGEVAFSKEFWFEVLRVLKPGGHVAAFGASRGYHRMACAIEDAGFEIRDSLMWVYGTGFPKSHDVSKGIDKAAGAEREVLGQKIRGDVEAAKRNGVTMAAADANKNNKAIFGYGVENITAPATDAARQWEGWGTALKPAFEPIVLARKPLSEGTVAANVLRWGTGALNIDGCRISGRERTDYGLANATRTKGDVYGEPSASADFDSSKGRWPANCVHDGSDEVVGAFPRSDSARIGNPNERTKGRSGMFKAGDGVADYRDSGSAARFFYSAKASRADRAGSKHPTVKPIALMQWLARLITPPGGTVLDPFAGSGTIGEAAFREGFNSVLIEREAEYQTDIRHRMAVCMYGPDERRREIIKAKVRDLPFAPGSLFAGLEAAE